MIADPDPFHEIRRKLQLIMRELSLLRGRSPKTAEIHAIILIYPNITQKRIRQLTQFSLGTISNGLKELEKELMIIKKYSKDSKEFMYCLNPDALNLQSRTSSDTRGAFSSMDIIKRLADTIDQKLNQPESASKSGYNELLEFSMKIRMASDIYTRIIQKFATAIKQQSSK